MRWLLLLLPGVLVLLGLLLSTRGSAALTSLRAFGERLRQLAARTEALRGARSDQRGEAEGLGREFEATLQPYLRWREQVLQPALAVYEGGKEPHLAAAVVDECEALRGHLRAFRQEVESSEGADAELTALHAEELLEEVCARQEDDRAWVCLLELGFSTSSFSALVAEPTRELLGVEAGLVPAGAAPEGRSAARSHAM